MQRQEPEDGALTSQPEAKRQKTEEQPASNGAAALPERVKGVTPIKPEYLIAREAQASTVAPASYDDEAEGGGISERAESSGQI